MKSALALYVQFCVVCSVCLGQWSAPALVWHDTTGMSEARLICTPADTLWAAVMDRGSNGSFGWYRIQTAWSMGDSWSGLTDATGQDSAVGWYSGMGFGCDPQDRLWLGWYRGNAYTFQGEDSWAVCTAKRDDAGWHPFEKSIDSFWSSGAESFAADRQGNWYLSVVACALDAPGIIESAMYSRLDGDSWMFPRGIAAGMGTPISSGHYSMVLVPHPDSGLWEVNDWSAYREKPRVYVHRVLPDTTFEMLYMPGEASTATADSSGSLFVVYVRDSALRAARVTGNAVTDSWVIADAPRFISVCTDPLGWVWTLWMSRDNRAYVSYNRGAGWSTPEQVCDSLAQPHEITSDSRGRVYVLASVRLQGEWALYSTYRLLRPGIEESGEQRAGSSRRAASIGRCLPVGAVAFDATGRRVVNPRSGILFLRQASSVRRDASSVTKVVITR